MDPKKITELANLFRYDGDKILSSEFTLTLSGSLLRALNDSFTLIADAETVVGMQKFQVTKPMNSKSPVFRDLQLVHDFVQKTTYLCIIHYPTEEYFSGPIDISKFHSLKRLEIRKVRVRQIEGIQPLRSQLQQLICIKSLESVEDIITHCGGDRTNGFVWNELKIADFSYNNLQSVNSSLEFAQYLEQLILRHNKLINVKALKWLPHLKSLDLSYNCLQSIPQFHTDAYKRLQTLNLSNNYIEDLGGLTKMDALTELDLSDNCLLDHSVLMPLSALITLKYLSLCGNPLHCHPKHRMATAQFLHKNTSTVKFLLDLEPLSKSEKAITGQHQLRYATTGRYKIPPSSSTVSISSSRPTPSTHTPASSIGSLQSYNFQNFSNEIVERSTAAAAEGMGGGGGGSAKRKTTKIRMVEIEDDKSDDTTIAQHSTVNPFSSIVNEKSQISTEIQAKKALTQSLIDESSSSNAEHLEAKKYVESLRDKYGVEWLQSSNAAVMQSVLGVKSNPETSATNNCDISTPTTINEYLGEFSTTLTEQLEAPTPRTSTPMNEQNAADTSNTPTDSQEAKQTIQNEDNSLYRTAEECSGSMETCGAAATEPNRSAATANDDAIDELSQIYARSADVESENSEPEEEETYIVYPDKCKNALFLTLSENYLREKDTWTQRTKTKWSLKILESCERLKADIIRLNFDTIKKDKKERTYTVEDGLCLQLEKKLRDILSKRDLSEMNQTVYRCVNCSCQFSRENKQSLLSFPKQDFRCPECNSTFIAEIHIIPKSLDKVETFSKDQKLSPASIVEVESPVETPLIVKKETESAASASTIQQQQSVDSIEAAAGTEQNNSIGSVNSLNASSSCSKISANSQSSFDSNQSVVGSTNSERDLEFKVNCESDVDIISNPSQSSIEVLDPFYVDGRISQQPNLETIADGSFKQSYTDLPREIGHITTTTTTTTTTEEINAENSSNQVHDVSATSEESSKDVNPLNHVQLTESSSSGSIADSICTAYAPKNSSSSAEKSTVSSNLLLNSVERSNSSTATIPETNEKQEEEKSQITKKEDARLTSMFGAIFQSTNALMSSSKKFIDAESTSSIKTGEKIPLSINNDATKKNVNCIMPYKFNFSDFNDIDHRLKLYFYQTKFEDEGEHFEWLLHGRIFNENNRTLFTGIVAMSTRRIFLMEAFAPQNDIVSKWLRQIMSVNIDCLERVQLLPWKIGCSFKIRNWGNFSLLLQDSIRLEGLLHYFSSKSPSEQCCDLVCQPAECITRRLHNAVDKKKLNMFALLNGCEISCDNAKRSFEMCGLLITDTHLYLTSGKLNWLVASELKENEDPDELELERCVIQLMSNLVDVEILSNNTRAINFLDETNNKCEMWKLYFETKENADCTMDAIGPAWQALFGVSLFGS